MDRVALLLPYTLKGPEGPRIYLQRHSDHNRWRLFGGRVKRGETPLEAVTREAKQELCHHEFNPQDLGEGWTPPQLLCRMRIPFGGVYLFPIEADPNVLKNCLEPGEGAEGKWHSLKQLPDTLSKLDKILLKAWVVRRFVLNQPYISSEMQCPIVTVDVEEPHHYEGRNNDEGSWDFESTLNETIENLLEQLDHIGARATFFCVGTTARKHKNLIRLIAKRNEVASHGTDHLLACTQSLTQFQKDLTKSKEILEDITGCQVTGYRAPSWSWPRDVNQSARYYEELAKAGYRYDSSVIPAAVIGVPGGPSIPYRTDAGVYEFPLPCCGVPFVTKNLDRFAKDGTYRPPLRVRRGAIGMPYSGGLFLRCVGMRFASLVLSYHLKKRGYAMVYAHPGELSGYDASWLTKQDSRYLNLFERWRMGFRTRNMKSCFFSIVRNYCGCSIEQFLNDLEIIGNPLRITQFSPRHVGNA